MENSAFWQSPTGHLFTLAKQGFAIPLNLKKEHSFTCLKRQNKTMTEATSHKFNRRKETAWRVNQEQPGTREHIQGIILLLPLPPPSPYFLRLSLGGFPEHLRDGSRNGEHEVRRGTGENQNRLGDMNRAVKPQLSTN